MYHPSASATLPVAGPGRQHPPADARDSRCRRSAMIQHRLYHPGARAMPESARRNACGGPAGWQRSNQRRSGRWAGGPVGKGPHGGGPLVDCTAARAKAADDCDDVVGAGANADISDLSSPLAIHREPRPSPVRKLPRLRYLHQEGPPPPGAGISTAPPPSGCEAAGAQ